MRVVRTAWAGAAHCPGGAAGKFDGSAGAERKISAGGEFGDAVDKRPSGPGQRHRVAGREIAGLLRGGDALQQNLERHSARRIGLFVPSLRGLRQIEHDQEVLRPAQGKLHITAAALPAAAPVAKWPRAMLFRIDGGEPVEPLGSDRHQQFVLAGKVAIGGIVGDAGAARHLAQGECAGADLADQGDGGVEQGLAKIGVMVGLRIGSQIIFNR